MKKLFIFLFCLGCYYSVYSNDKNDNLLDLAGFAPLQNEKLELKGFGTGFAVSPDGYLVTASHVTEGCDAVRLIFKDGRNLDAKVIKEEPKLDLALLKVDIPTPSHLTVTSRTSGLGDDIYTIGYPSPNLLGVNQKFTKGSISALSGLLDDSFRYQISIPIQPGNSGGPVVCEETGEVVGIIVSSLKGKEVVGFNPQSVNYALKSAFIKPILDSLEVRQNVLSKTSSNKNERRKKVVDSTCMVVTCKFVRVEESLQTSKEKAPKDTIAPRVTLLGEDPITIEVGQQYSEPGAVSDGDEHVWIEGNVDCTNVGAYNLNYFAKDIAGNVGQVGRTVFVVHKKNSVHSKKAKLSLITLKINITKAPYGFENFVNGKKVSIGPWADYFKIYLNGKYYGKYDSYNGGAYKEISFSPDENDIKSISIEAGLRKFGPIKALGFIDYLIYKQKIRLDDNYFKEIKVQY